MKNDEWTHEDLVIVSVGEDWPGSPPKNLVSYSFTVDRDAKDVLLIAVFDGPISDDDRDEILALEGAVGGQIPADWQANTRLVLLEEGEATAPGASTVIFQRGSAVTPNALVTEVLGRHGR